MAKSTKRRKRCIFYIAWLAKKLAKVWKRRRQKKCSLFGQTDRIKDIHRLPMIELRRCLKLGKSKSWWPRPVQSIFRTHLEMERNLSRATARVVKRDAVRKI